MILKETVYKTQIQIGEISYPYPDILSKQQ